MVKLSRDNKAQVPVSGGDDIPHTRPIKDTRANSDRDCESMSSAIKKDRKDAAEATRTIVYGVRFTAWFILPNTKRRTEGQIAQIAQNDANPWPEFQISKI